MYEKTLKFLEKNVGKIIEIDGTISEAMWQHKQIHLDCHPNLNYFDLESGFQVIAYSKTPISCEDKIEIKGRIEKIEEEGETSKDVETKGRNTEYYIIVSSWKCIN